MAHGVAARTGQDGISALCSALGRQPPQGIVFDLDGTLWDSSRGVALAWDRVVRRRLPSHPGITHEAIAGTMGLAHAQIVARLFPRVERAAADAIVRECYREEAQLLRREGALLYPGVREGLALLRHRLPLFIVSNCQAGYIEVFLEWSGLGTVFADRECHGNTGLSKGENLRLLLERNRIGRAVLVGDTAGDMAAAREAGAPFIHAGWGFGQVESPDAACASFAELTGLLLALTPV